MGKRQYPNHKYIWVSIRKAPERELFFGVESVLRSVRYVSRILIKEEYNISYNMRAEAPFSTEDFSVNQNSTAEITKLDTQPYTDRVAGEMLSYGTVSPQTIVRKGRFAEGMPFTPVDIVASELTSLSVGMDKVTAIFVQHQLSRESSIRLGLGISPNTALQEVFDATVGTKEDKEMLERELDGIDQYKSAKDDFERRVREAPYRKIPDTNLRYAIPVPPTSVLYERYTTRSNGIGWSGETEVIAALKMQYREGENGGEITTQYLGGTELDQSIQHYRQVKKDERKRQILQELEERYRLKKKGEEEGPEERKAA